MPFSFQDPAGIFELIEVVGNGTYGQVYKVWAGVSFHCFDCSLFLEFKLTYSYL